MNIVVATDGSLDPDMTAKMLGPHVGNASVTVLTAVEIPRRLLAELRAVYGERVGPGVDTDGEYVGISPGQPNVALDFPGDDAIIGQYLLNQRDQRTADVATALEGAGFEVAIEILEGENAASLILDYIRDKKADLVVLGAKGRGLIEVMIGSTGTKVARLAPCSVLLVRA